MSEKIADDYGLTQLLAYLKAHAYTGGTNGTFALATDSDMDAVLTTGESTDWSDGQSVKKSIGYYNTPAWPSKGICNYVHVPGNSIIFEYMMNTQDSNIGQNGPVSQPSGACYVPYYLNAINKSIFDAESYSSVILKKIEDIKSQYDAHQATLNEHCTMYASSKSSSVFTSEDIAYAYKYMKYLGKAGSTESSWTYALSSSTVLGNSIFSLANHASDMNGAVYNETKARERLHLSQSDYPKLKNLGFFELLFGDFDAYIAYLSGGAS